MNPTFSASESAIATYSFRGSSEARCPALDRQTTYRRAARCGLRLRDEALDLVFLPADPVRFIPVNFRCADAAILESESSNPLPFTPSAWAVCLLQAADLADSTTRDHGLDVADGADDLEHLRCSTVHVAIGRRQ